MNFQKGLDSVIITFPVLQHMEFDKNYDFVNQKTSVETPVDWISMYESYRNKPIPFMTKNVNHSFLRQWDRLEKILRENLHSCDSTIYGIETI